MNEKQIFENKQAQVTDQKQQQRLMMLPKMQQAMRILQAPTLEISALIEEEMEQNPLLDYVREETETLDESTPVERSDEPKELQFEDQDFSLVQELDETFRDQFAQIGDECTPQTQEESRKRAYLESLTQTQPTLSEHLIRQIYEIFQKEDDQELAKIIIGNLDGRGYFTTPVEEIARLEDVEMSRIKEILQKIQQFTPYGIGAENLQESLLIQLKCLGQERSLTYKIVRVCFEDLMHNRIPRICRHLHCSPEEVRQIIDTKIASLNLQPGSDWENSRSNKTIFPDATLTFENDQVTVVLPEEAIPQLGLNMRYLKLLRNDALAEETRNFIRQKLLSARWLMRTINQRHQTLSQIAHAIGRRQHHFFAHSKGQLTPWTFKELAQQLELHESTIARAIANKYIDTPRGVYLMKFFFTTHYQTETGEELSADTVRQLLRTIISEENKRTPLSDEAISKEMKRRGVECARRTVAKYRLQNNIGNTRQRRQF